MQRIQSTAVTQLEEVRSGKGRQNDPRRNTHLRFCAKLYRIQMEQGLYFLHEHPAHAKSWKDPEIERRVNNYRVKTVTGNMCMFGMTQESEGSSGLVKKDTKFMTNAIMIAERLNRVCDKTHKHVLLIGGRAKNAQVYPEELRSNAERTARSDEVRWKIERHCNRVCIRS